jgi:hypothetical protein
MKLLILNPACVALGIGHPTAFEILPRVRQHMGGFKSENLRGVAISLPSN